MPRASASSTCSEREGTPLYRRWWRPFFYASVAAILATAWGTVGLTGVSFAVEDDDNKGSLELNTDVIVNDTVSAGSSSEFAVRGRLFLGELTARSQALQDEANARLLVDETLTFVPQGDETLEQYQALRAGLFQTYTAQTLEAEKEEETDLSLIVGVGLGAGVLVTVVGGIMLGMKWARRKRSVA